MKTKYFTFILALFASSLSLYLTSCSEDEQVSLDLTGDVKIGSFQINDAAGTIDDVNNTIEIYVPSSTDLTNVTPVISLGDGATVSPASGETVDLSSKKTYRVINGNLFNEYKVTATLIEGKILSFAIGDYKGTINQSDKTITIKYPASEDITALTPEITITDDATVSPANGEAVDFTNAVTYTVSYLDETFDYEVTLVPTNFKTIAFVGTAASASQIDNDDEAAAYQWLTENVVDQQYISFDDIEQGNVTLSNFAVVWWHYDNDASDLPAASKTATVLSSFENYYQNGGSLFLSSWAVQYVAYIGVAKDSKVANNMWNQNNSGTVVGEDWGLYVGDQVSHPIYDGLELSGNENNIVYLLGAGCNVKAHDAIWNFDWGDYGNNIAGWSTASGAINLGSFQWADNLTSRAVIWEYPAIDGSGAAICIGTESYDWTIEDGTNSYSSNMEKLSLNILDYLSE